MGGVSVMELANDFGGLILWGCAYPPQDYAKLTVPVFTIAAQLDGLLRLTAVAKTMKTINGNFAVLPVLLYLLIIGRHAYTVYGS